MTEEQIRETPEPLDPVAELVDLEKEPSIDDDFFRERIVHPERLVDLILESPRVSAESWAEIFEHYLETIQQFYLQNPLSSTTVLAINERTANVAAGFQGVAATASALSIERMRYSEENTRKLRLCYKFYDESTAEHFRSVIERYGRGSATRNAPHRRLIVANNFLAAAWSTRLPEVAAQAQKTLELEYPGNYEEDIGAYIAHYSRTIEETARRAVNRRIPPELRPRSVGEGHLWIKELMRIIPRLGSEQKKALYESKEMRALMHHPHLRLIAGLYRHFEILSEISESRRQQSHPTKKGVELPTEEDPPLTERDQVRFAKVPDPLVYHSHVIQPHVHFIEVFAPQDFSSLNGFLYHSIPVAYDAMFPYEDVGILIDRVEADPDAPGLLSEATAAISSFAGQQISRFFSRFHGLAEGVRPHSPVDAAYTGVWVVTHMFPELIFDKEAEKASVVLDANRLRALIRRYGWEVLSVSGEVYKAETNPHLRKRGLKSLSIQFAPYFSGSLKEGYVFSLEFTKPIQDKTDEEDPNRTMHFLLKGYDTLFLLGKNASGYEPVSFKCSRSAIDYLLRYLLQHLAPLKKGELPVYHPSTRIEERVFREPSRWTRTKHAHVQARRVSEKRPFYSEDSWQYGRFLDLLHAKGYHHKLEDLWADADNLLAQIEDGHPGATKRHMRSNEEGRIEIDSLIFRMVVAPEISYDQVLSLEAEAYRRYLQIEDSPDPTTEIEAQIHIWDLKRLEDESGKIPQHEVTMPGSFDG